MFISFEKLVLDCIHKNGKNKFHTRIDINKLRKAFTQIHDKLEEWNSQSFEQLTDLEPGEKEEFKPLLGERRKLASYFSRVGNNQKIEKLILNSNIWQLRVNEEIRIIGILERNCINKDSLPDEIKESGKDLFYVLFYDFEHTAFPDPDKQPKEEDLVCLMSEKCPAYIFLPREKD